MAEIESLESKVSLLSGTATSQDNVQTFLLDGCRHVVSLAKLKGTTAEFTKLDTSPGASAEFSLDNIYDVIEVTRGSTAANGRRICSFIDNEQFTRAADSNSLYYEDNSDFPVYTIEGSASNRVLKVLPTPAASSGLVYIRVIPEYSVDNFSNGYIEFFPRKYSNLIVHYAAIRELNKKILDERITLPALPATVPSASFSYNSPLISSIVGDLLDESSLSNPPGDLSISAVPPVMGALDWSDTENWISTEEDPEMLNSRVSEIQARISEFNSKVQEYSSSVSKEVQEYTQNMSKWQTEVSNELQVLVQNAQNNLTVDQANLNKETQVELQKAIKDLEADVQEYQSNLSKYQADIATYQAEVASNVQDYQAIVSAYQAQLSECRANYAEILQLEFGDVLAPANSGGQ